MIKQIIQKLRLLVALSEEMLKTIGVLILGSTSLKLKIHTGGIGSILGLPAKLKGVDKKRIAGKTYNLTSELHKSNSSTGYDFKSLNFYDNITFHHFFFS